MENISAERLEKILKTSTSEFAKATDTSVSTMYSRKSGKASSFYKFALLGYWLSKSTLRIREIILVIETAEKIKGK